MPLISEGAEGPDYGALTFPEPPAGRPYVVTNMVSSADGKVVVEGNERGIGSATDQRLMRELRAHADVVLNGAGTLRASGSSSRIGDPALEARRVRAFFTSREFPAVVYLSDSAPAERRAAIEATGRPLHLVPDDEPLPEVLRHMREELRASLVLVEGGPSLNGAFFDRGLIDEYFLTLGSVLVGGSGVSAAIEGRQAPSRERLRSLDLVSAYADTSTSELYMRYRLRPAAPASVPGGG
jgi:2,5-diamino-6-(ribosylamino)-4(3H)-pyrimidinone 5'-phosphate reductase